MENKISIAGTLFMLDGKTPHVAVPVQAICEGQVVKTTLSDDSGRYQFFDLKPEIYQLRCQVLGGYIYYGTQDCVSPAMAGEDNGQTLQVEHWETINNADFYFAPFKKGTWRSYTTLDGLAHNTVYDIYSDPGGYGSVQMEVSLDTMVKALSTSLSGMGWRIIL